MRQLFQCATPPCRALVLALALTVAAGSSGAATAVGPACTPQDQAVPWQAVAPGIWVWAPDDVRDIDAANAGFVAPVSALVDGARAWVIDPGPSLRHGQRVRASLRCRWGAEVVGVFNTHAHAEAVLGNAAFADVPLRLALAGTRTAMAARCPSCLAELTDQVGTEVMAATAIVLPTATLRPGDTLTLGRHTLQVRVAERAHTEADLLLWHPDSRWLWAGGLVYDRRIPELAQGSVLGWLAALEQVRQLQPEGVVGQVVARAAAPGQPIAAVEATHRYLATLRDRVWQAMEAGQGPLDAGGQGMADWAAWVGHAERQGFNALRAWRELEPLWMGSPPGLPPPAAALSAVPSTP